MTISPHDGSAVQLVPTNVEKLPLYHWHPGWRLLAIGSRDGARFDGHLDPSEERSFRRPLSAALLEASVARSGVEGVAATWSASLRYPRNMELLTATDLPLVVQTAGAGDAVLLEALLPRVAAWVLLVDKRPGPLSAAIVAGGAHVEVVWGLDDVPSQLPDLAWDRVAAVHLQPIRATAAVGGELEAWEGAAADLLPKSLPVYHSQRRSTSCRSCGADLVWRHGGRSRLDALAADGTCSRCGQPTGIQMPGV